MTRRVVRAGSALVLAAAIVSGCASGGGGSRADESSKYEGRAGGPKVAIVGDSITELSRARIVEALTDDQRVRIDASTGYTIAQMTPEIRRQVATRPDVVVVNLGTNDMDLENPRWRRDVDRMLDLVAEVPCVELVTVHDGVHDPVGANVGTSINARLGEVAAARRSFHLIDWNTAVRERPGLVVADGIHPTAAGQRFLADAIRDAIRDDC
jgi:lysophospholipase L1-like esterase